MKALNRAPQSFQALHGAGVNPRVGAQQGGQKFMCSTSRSRCRLACARGRYATRSLGPCDRPKGNAGGAESFRLFRSARHTAGECEAVAGGRPLRTSGGVHGPSAKLRLKYFTAKSQSGPGSHSGTGANLFSRAQRAPPALAFLLVASMPRARPHPRSRADSQSSQPHRNTHIAPQQWRRRRGAP